MAVDGAVRASDPERDQTLDRLSVAYSEGRLDRAEFDHRVDQALATRTRRELAELVADLPQPGPLTVPPPPHEPSHIRAWRLLAGVCCCIGVSHRV